MAKDDSLYLGHMLDIARKVVTNTSGLSRADYDQDENLRLDPAHLVQVIGEAARRASPETQKAHPEIPWANIIGMRHKVVHDYLEVDEDIIWAVARVDLPALVKALERIVPPED